MTNKKCKICGKKFKVLRKGLCKKCYKLMTNEVVLHKQKYKLKKGLLTDKQIRSLLYFGMLSRKGKKKAIDVLAGKYDNLRYYYVRRKKK